MGRPRGVGDVTRFSGTRLPSTNFQSVADGLLVQYEFDEIDLTPARSIAAGTELVIPRAGNVLYVDQKDDVGNATIVFQDTSKTARPGRVFVQPGSNFYIPFTRLTIENTAQAGRVLRYFYGVDIDFRAGNSNVVQTVPLGVSYGTAFQSNTLIAAGGTEQVFSVAQNPNGAIIWDAHIYSTHATQPFVNLQAGLVAPVSSASGHVIINPDTFFGFAGFAASMSKLANPLRIPAGRGLWFFSLQLEIGAVHEVKYTLF